MIRRLLLLLSLLALLLAPSSALASTDVPPDEAPVELELRVPWGYVGDVLTVEVTATRGGHPVPGLAVQLGWSGFDVDGEASTALTTDTVGAASHQFVLTGPRDFTATAVGDTGEVLAAVGPVTSSVYYCRCSLPWPRLRAFESDGKRDRIVLKHPSSRAAGATARLFRVEEGRAVLIRQSLLDDRGRRAWRVSDHDGPRVTRYYAILLAGPGLRESRTPVIRVR